MNIQKATQRYETWLSRHLSIIAEDLELKHREMRSLPFPFLRATYYRWAQTFPEICGDLARAPKALAVGDLHAVSYTHLDVYKRQVITRYGSESHSRKPASSWSRSRTLRRIIMRLLAVR